ncbi:hypothetical protein [Tellurirhabdus rosea]|uniref:hypothetical protein n=1 Tax=Tellurirhabdus rosea TaxID=2674997 RepID=UPI00225A09F8|nr:hypothetical protein [Tellurirhabdus rosea]
MKRSGLLFLLFLFLVNIQACKDKNSEAVDPRNQYIGNYDVAYTSSTTLNDFPFVPKETASGTIVITKGAAADELKLAIAFKNYNEEVGAKLQGNKFTVLKQKEKVYINEYNTFEADYAGSGEFSGANLNITAIAQTTANGGKVVKNMVFNGIKK